jgi:hypothetical protein
MHSCSKGIGFVQEKEMQSAAIAFGDIYQESAIC